MKKVFLYLSCLLPIYFIGCASNAAPSDINIDAPETVEETNGFTEDESLEDSPSEPDNNEIETTFETETEELPETTEVLFPELDDLEEPVVITLDPPESEENEDITDTEDELQEEELIEIDLPIEEPQNPEITDIQPEDNSEQSDSNIPDETNEEITESTNSDEQDTDETITLSTEDDVIDITDDDASATENLTQKVIDEIIPSRKVTMKKFEYLDVTYPGNGWVFMGLLDGSKDMTYNGRKLGTGQTNFTLQARNAGTKIIHFYKEDNLTNTTIDDFIEVEILDEKGSNKDHIVAPEYKLPLTPKAKEIIKSAEKKEDSKIEIKNETAASVIPVEINNTAEEKNNEEINSLTDTSKNEEIKPLQQDSKLLLQEANLLYNEKEYLVAKNKLDEFFEVAVNNRDEGLFLQGKILEAKSNIQNIKGAIEAYTTLTKNYPASKYWDDANKRIIYLKRFYLEVR